MDGGAGNDNLDAHHGGVDTMRGGAGDDRLYAYDTMPDDDVDCGLGSADRAIVDVGEASVNCELVSNG
jgi:hypothetical protein